MTNASVGSHRPVTSRKPITRAGLIPTYLDSERFRALIRDDHERFGKIIRDAGIVPH